MGSATVRLSESGRATLRELAARSGESTSAVLEKAIECYRRQRFLDEANAAYAALRLDAEAWAHEQKERGDWETTLGDGLGDESGAQRGQTAPPQP